MLDLQRRLARVGLLGEPDPSGQFGPCTESALRAFQQARGLPCSGRCDRATWINLVEACYRLGDRILYRRSPMLRGDDVSELQRRLGQLGFDAGRIDGIFGPDTHRAVADFQRNAGLVADGICGQETLAALDRIRFPRTQGGIAQIREAELLRSQPKTLLGRRIVVSQQGGLSSIAHGLTRVLRRDGANVLALDDSPESEQAAAANAFDGHLFVGLEPADDLGTITYYRGPGFESPGGKQLAGLLVDALAPIVGVASPVGATRPVLRETRMTAITCALGPAHLVVNRSPQLTAAFEHAITAWIRQPVGH